MIFQYVRNRQNQRVGIVVACSKEQVGWSACKKGDRFNKERGMEIAIGRASVGSEVKPPLYVSFTLEIMKERAERYFK